MNTKRALLVCPICDGIIKRGASESWTIYNRRTACSVKCAATLRESKERNKIDAVMALVSAIGKWRVTS